MILFKYVRSVTSRYSKTRGRWPYIPAANKRAMTYRPMILLAKLSKEVILYHTSSSSLPTEFLLDFPKICTSTPPLPTHFLSFIYVLASPQVKTSAENHFFAPDCAPPPPLLLAAATDAAEAATPDWLLLLALRSCCCCC